MKPTATLCRGFISKSAPREIIPWGWWRGTRGYLGEITPKQLKSGGYPQNRMGDYIGQWGLEKEWQEELGGKKGGRFLEVNALGQEVRLVNTKESVAGNNLVTTLDWKLQKVAQESLQGRSGAVVVLKPATGEVLAMASSPTFDPSPLTEGFQPRNGTLC